MQPQSKASEMVAREMRGTVHFHGGGNTRTGKARGCLQVVWTSTSAPHKGVHNQNGQSLSTLALVLEFVYYVLLC